MSRQMRPLTTLRTVFFETPCSSASDCKEIPPAEYRARIATTASRVSFAFGCSSPLGGPPRALPFATMSETFSACVPRNRWAGFTQGGLSQTWQTAMPLGIGPFTSSQESRWARINPTSRPPLCNTPYPPWVCAPCHSQHSSDLTTFAQRRSSSDKRIFISQEYIAAHSSASGNS